MKMLQTAEREDLTPRQLADRNVPRFQAMVRSSTARTTISSAPPSRATTVRRRRSGSAWRRTATSISTNYSGWYSVRDEAYYDESETQIDERQALAPTGTPVEWVEEESYFFRLSAYQDKLLAHLRGDPDFIAAARAAQRGHELRQGRPCGSLDLAHHASTGASGCRAIRARDVRLVDALTNYITGVGLSRHRKRMFKRYWPADLHVIGKDIVRFHAVYWPAFLMSAGFAVPRRDLLRTAFCSTAARKCRSRSAT